ncbi:hypothetical protein DERP_012796 [Dermatophagoides pteronyssinus]|uniref:Uncharacterized protein n=1 Tax=Dermatophagoides pteronyssinus TaxID=6956 RepID=A0ABQ8JF58_DERPT|nr:hypothetical protein DERP_012796 [Dermatophagoides pteronyssinus]
MMIPPYVIIKICDHHYKVPSNILCQSSQFFNALIHFHNDIDDSNENQQQSTTSTSSSSSTSPTIDLNEIEIIENEKQDVFRKIMNRFLAIVAVDDPIEQQQPQQDNNYNQQQQQQNQDSLDFLFDCILVCSKYFFDYLERIYSDEFVQKLRNITSELAVTDVIVPNDDNSNDDKHSNNDNDTNDCWLSMLEIYRLAQVYNLEYLSEEILELIREKRSYFLRRLRNTYYFW